MADVQLTPQAEADLYDIWQGIAVDSTVAADRLVTRFLKKAQLAADFPEMGVARPEIGPAVRLLIEGRYLVIYEPRSWGILVVAVVHGMRDPQSWLR